MCRSNKWLIPTLILCVVGCRLIDLGGLFIQTVPSVPGEILTDPVSISLSFSRAVVEEEVEDLVVISNFAGVVSVDSSWDENTLTLIPVEELLQGTRYYLELKGLVPLQAGPNIQTNILVSFYYGTDQAKPYLVSSDPVQGETIGVLTPLMLTFSQSLDPLSFRENFSLLPSTSFEITWSAGLAAISPEEKWENLTHYTWSLDSKTESSTELPLAKTYRGSFLVQEDTLPPLIDCVFPTTYTGAEPVPLGTSLPDILYSEAIAVIFNEAVNEESMRSAFEIAPALSGTLIRHDNRSFVFQPEQGWDFLEDYTLSISTALTDMSGNPLQADYIEFFQPTAIPAVTIIEVSGQGAAPPPVVFGLADLSPQAIDVDELQNFRYTFSILFDQVYADSFRASVEDAVGLEYIMPGGTAPILVRRTWWGGGNQLSLEYEGFDPGLVAGQPSIYRLTISAGPGSRNQNGGYLAEDLSLYLGCAP